MQVVSADVPELMRNVGREGNGVVCPQCGLYRPSPRPSRRPEQCAFRAGWGECAAFR